MKVSIITIAFNAADTIEETIQSVINQDHQDLEYIVIDGGSKDDTLSILEKYKSNIDVLVSEPDKGVYDAMNKGIARATGELVAILNADDVYANSRVISEAISILESQNCDAVYGDLQYVNRDNPDKVFRNWVSGKFKRSSFKWGWMPPHPTFMVKRKLYDSFGAFNTELRTSADYELMLRFLYKNEASIAYLPKVLVKMKVGGQSNASVSNRLKANKEDQKAWELNNVRPFFFTLWLKPLRKIRQFLPF
jgi:glycosyltransferase